MFRICVDNSHHCFVVSGIFQLDLDGSWHSKRRFDVVDYDGWFGVASKVELVEDLTYLGVDETKTAFLLSHLQRQKLELIVVCGVGLELKRWVAIESNSINNNLIAIFCSSAVRHFNLLDMSFSYLTFHIQSLQRYRIISDDWDCVPYILRTLLFEESYTTGVLSTQHRLNCKLEFLFAAWRNCQFFGAFAVKNVSLDL